MSTQQRFLKSKYLLSAALFISGLLVAGDCDQVKKATTRHEYELDKLFAQLPSAIGLYIISFAVKPLCKVITFEELAFSKNKMSHWIPIKKEFVSARTSQTGEYIWFSPMTCSRRKRETKPHDSVTVRIVQQFYKEIPLKQ